MSNRARVIGSIGLVAVWSVASWWVLFGIHFSIEETCAIVNGEVTEEQKREWPYRWKRGNLLYTLTCMEIRDNPENFRKVAAGLAEGR